MMPRRSIRLVLPLLAVSAALVFAGPGTAAPGCSKDWNGNDANWGTAGEWTPAGAPAPTDIVCIASGTATLSADASVQNIRVSGTGTLVVSDASLTLDVPGGAAADGAMSVTANATLREAGTNSSVVGNELVNGGTVQIAAPGTSRVLKFADTPNSGTLDVDENVDMFVPGGSTLTNTGTIDIAAGKRMSDSLLTFTMGGGQISGSGEFAIQNGSIHHGAGDVASTATVGIFAGSIDLSGTGTAAYTAGLGADAGGFTSGTTLAGDIASGKTLRVRGGDFNFAQNSAKVVLDADRTNNGAILMDSVNANGPNTTLDVGTHTLTNNSAITIQGSMGTRTISGTTGALANGTTGTVNVNRDVTITAPITNRGAFTVAASKTATTDDNFVQTAGTTTLESSNLNQTGSAEFQLQGGVLTGTGGSVDGNLVNSGGDVSPAGPAGSQGHLDVIGNYTQTAGTLSIDLTGSCAGCNDELFVSNDTTLSGTLALRTNGFTPATGDNWDVLDALSGTISGAFTTETGLSAGGRTYAVTYPGGPSPKVHVAVVPQFTLTVGKSGTGGGGVSSSPAGIDCGADCTQDYDETATVTLNATPAAGSTFTGWSGSACSGTGTCQVSMTAARSVTANFTLTDSDGDGVPDIVDPAPNDPSIPTKFGATNGNDTITGTPAGETICGLLGNDVINALGGDDTVFGDNCGVKAKVARATATGGNDTIDGASGNDTIYGAGGADKLKGGDGNDKLFGGGGNDVLSGGKGNDSLDGGKGNDKLTGGPGVNKYSGGDGNDLITARNGKKETVNCGAGKKDSATVDKRDKVKGCEKVKRAKK